MKQLLFVLLFSLTVFAQQSSDATAPAAPAPAASSDAQPAAAAAVASPSSSAAQPAAPDAQATLIVFREKHFQGSALKPSIYVDGQEVARLKNGSYYSLPIKTGKHELASSAKHESALELDIKPGETNYVQMIVVAGTWRGAGRLVPVPAEDGKATIAKLKPLDKD